MKRAAQSNRITPARWLWERWPLSLTLLVLLLIWQAEAAMRGVRAGMQLCAHTMIPALFPFMVVSEWMVRGRAGEMLASWRPLRYVGSLLGLSEAGFCSFLMGILCGFPIGSRVAAAYFRRGRLSREEFNRVLCLCNVPSTAFLANAVGVGLFGSAALGRWLCLLPVASVLLIGLGLRLFCRKRTPPTVAPICELSEHGPRERLPAAMSSAASGMLNVCATVILFGALTSVLDGALTEAGFSPGAKGRACLLGVLELSGGVSEVAAAFDASYAAVICAALIGWGGLSVHCQIFSECRGCPLRLPSFWFSRLAQAVLCGGGMALLILSGVLAPDSFTPGGVMTWAGRFPTDVIGRIIWGIGVGGMAIALGCRMYLKWTRRRANGRSVKAER